VILEFLFGLFIGIISGLIPGLHSNTVIAVLSSVGLDDNAMAIIISALFSAHIIASFIPSIFFGIPSDTSVVSVLPGQRMVKQGHGILAFKVVLLSALFALLVSVVLFNPSLSAYQTIYAMLKPYMGYILLFFSIIFLSRAKNIFLSLCIFLLAGILGVFSLNLKIYDVFLPLFSGFFAMSAIITYQQGEKLPEQLDENPDISILKYSLIGVALGFFADLLPGIGAPSQIAVLATIFIPINAIAYLATIASISASEAVFSFSTSAAIDKSRMGATEWLSNYISIEQNLALLLTIFLAAAAITAALAYLARKHIGKLVSLNFSKLNALIAAYLVAITFILDGVIGILVLLISTALGYATIRLNVERTTLMGAIIVPTLLLLFKIFLL
jgi:putative membrane protein